MVFRGDDRSFQEKGYTSVTITEENIWDVIHTENDVETVIDYNRLDKITLSLLHFINNYGTSII